MARWAILIYAVLSGSAGAQTSLSLAELDAFAAAELERIHAPGAALAIVQGDRIVYRKGYGVASSETRAPVTPDMLFRVGSTTKVFVAAAVLRLAEAGKLRIDEPVGRYLPGLDPRVARLTAEQLLSHTAGLKDETNMYGPHDDEALAAQVATWDAKVFFAEPGAIYSYSNLGYVLAGRLVEAVHGKPFADALAELVLEPLGMRRSTFRPTVAMTYPLALSHTWDRKLGFAVVRPLADHAGWWPAGSLFSSVEEMARFAIAFLNGGRIDGVQALSPALIAALQKIRATIPTPEPDRYYAFGLQVHQTRGVATVEHTGSRLGYTSVLRMAPEQRVALVAMCNANHATFGRVVDRASEMLLPYQPRLPGGDTGPPSPPSPESRPEELAGRYRNGGAVRAFRVVHGRLTAVQEGANVPLEPIPPRCYATAAATTPTRFCFVRSGDSIYLHTGGRSYSRTAE